MSSGNRRERRAAEHGGAAGASSLDERYGTRPVTRQALAPGLLGAMVLLAGLALVGSEAFVLIRYGAAILALVVAVFAWQAERRAWVVPMAVIAVVWNPVWPIPFHGEWWLVAQIAGAAVLTLAAVLIRGERHA